MLVPYFDSSIFQAMELHRPSQILLPNAQRVVFTFGRPITLSHAHLFSGPNLTCLNLDFHGGSYTDDDRQTALLSLLSSLKEKCANLRQLIVYGGPFSASSTLSNLILTSPHLQNLIIPANLLTGCNDILRLASLSSLQLLEVKLPESISTLSSIHFPRDPFPALRQLTLYAEHLSDCLHLIETVRPRLLSAQFHTSSPSSDYVQKMLDSVM